jgi:hypothetical protein
MSRRKATIEVVPEQATPQPVVIDPNAVRLADDVHRLLKLRTSTLRREIRSGRLRVCNRAGRYFFLGSQLLDWLRGCELPQRQPLAPGSAA